MQAAERFPLGDAISLSQLAENPYPIYQQLRLEEPLTWCRCTNMYLLTRYDDVAQVLRDTEHFIAGTDHSLIMDTFGEHMLTTEGALHDAYKKPLLPLFRPAPVRASLSEAIGSHVADLIDALPDTGPVEMRSRFANRLPVLTMLSLFGLPPEDEPLLRGWYDAFEKALSNFTWDDAVRREAKSKVEEFHAYLQRNLDAKRKAPDESLLSQMLAVTDPQPLTDAEIRRNASIIVFGGISTVEALILNSLFVLTESENLQQRLRRDKEALPAFLDEVVRWSGPVQSATRHVARPVELYGVRFEVGDTVNCMIAAANHDPGVFEDPETFDMDRPNLKRHIGFAIGAHHCLGSHLAKLESAIALEKLLACRSGLRKAASGDSRLHGHEFRQPRSLQLEWYRP